MKGAKEVLQFRAPSSHVGAVLIFSTQGTVLIQLGEVPESVSGWKSIESCSPKEFPYLWREFGCPEFLPLKVVQALQDGFSNK